MNQMLNSDSVIKKLTDVVELDYDAASAYREAIDRLDDTASKSKLQEFLRDHERHISDLSEVIRKEGGTPPDSGDFKKVLTKGKVQLADLAGDDAILKAMKTNEDQTISKYESMVEEEFPNHILTILEQGLKDERRHRTWMETTLKQFS